MDFLLDILEQNGYKVISGSKNSFSTMKENELYCKFQKGESVFIWGLNEIGKPPTLIFPRPKIRCKSSIFCIDEKKIIEKEDFFQFKDDIMNQCLKEFSHEDIYLGILNNWIFDLNKKEIKK